MLPFLPFLFFWTTGNLNEFCMDLVFDNTERKVCRKRRKNIKLQFESSERH